MNRRIMAIVIHQPFRLVPAMRTAQIALPASLESREDLLKLEHYAPSREPYRRPLGNFGPNRFHCIRAVS